MGNGGRENNNIKCIHRFDCLAMVMWKRGANLMGSSQRSVQQQKFIHHSKCLLLMSEEVQRCTIYYSTSYLLLLWRLLSSSSSSFNEWIDWIWKLFSKLRPDESHTAELPPAFRHWIYAHTHQMLFLPFLPSSLPSMHSIKSEHLINCLLLLPFGLKDINKIRKKGFFLLIFKSYDVHAGFRLLSAYTSRLLHRVERGWTTTNGFT